MQGPTRVLLQVPSRASNDFLGIQKPTVLRVLPANLGVITYYFVGFGLTGYDFH